MKRLCFLACLCVCLAATLGARAVDGYSVGIPVADARRCGVIPALERNGAPLPRDGMGSLSIVRPRNARPDLDRPEIHGRWVWQLAGIQVR